MRPHYLQEKLNKLKIWSEYDKSKVRSLKLCMNNLCCYISKRFRIISFGLKTYENEAIICQNGIFLIDIL